MLGDGLKTLLLIAMVLLVIEAAGKEFLSGGQPYRTYPEVYGLLAGKQPFEVLDVDAFARSYRGATVPMQYLPGIWLAYVPAVALGVDLRVLNVTFAVCIALVFERLLRFDQNRPVVLSLTFYPVILSPSVLGTLSALHVLHYWLLLLLTMLNVQARRYGLAAVLLGLSLATRQGALFVLPPLLAYLSLHLKWKEMVRYGLIALGVYLMVTVPFALWSGQGFLFWKHMYFDLTSLSEQVYQADRQIGMTSLLARAGLSESAALIQTAILLAAAAYVVVRRKNSLSWVLQAIGLTYIWAIFVNPYAVRYEYYPGLLLFVSGVAMALGDSPSSTETVGRNIRATAASS